MNHSLTVSRVHGPGLPPDHLSAVAWTTPSGGSKSASGMSVLYSRRNACHTWPAVVRDVAWMRVCGAEWSLFPIHTPTATAGASMSSGGARNPYVEKSLRLSAVPVFAAAVRRSPSGPLLSESVCDQKAFCFGSVLPARMSLIRNAAWGEIAATPSGV